VHVVGTKGKSTAARRIAATIGGVAYTSPHVSGWHERLETDEAGFERAIERVRPAAVELGATQFEVLTAAAFKDFEVRGVTAAAVEAGLGGRLDATNVIDARVVLLTNVALEHTEVLGESRQLIAAEKLAVAGPGAIVVLPDGEFADLVSGNDVRVGGAREAAEAFLGRPVELAEASLPGRLEVRDGEVRDGAHTPDAVDWLLERLARAGRTLVATRSSNERALPAGEVAARGRTWFEVVDTVDDPRGALSRAHELGPRVLVTGSLYLLADLYALAETGSDE